MSLRIGLLVNALPRARESRAKAIHLRRILQREGAHVIVPHAATRQEALQSANELVSKGGIDALVACGGDGMVNLAAQVLVGTDVPLGVLPAGTGCDFARAVGMEASRDPEVAASVLLGGRTKHIDVGHSEYGYFATILNCGFDARVTQRAAALRLPLGRFKYDAALVPELVSFHPTPLHLDLDGRVLDIPALLVAVGNTGYYGGGMHMCPGANPHDGLFEIIVISHAPRREVVRALLSVYRGAHLSNPHVTSFTARRVRITTPGREEIVTADGEILGPSPVTCDIVPRALRLLH